MNDSYSKGPDAMTTPKVTREDREAAASFYDGPKSWKQYPFTRAWVDSGEWPIPNADDPHQSAKERFAASFAAHRENAVQAERERIERELDAYFDNQSEAGWDDEMLRIVRGGTARSEAGRGSENA